LLDQSETGENLRREIVQAIATQMHWNTDLMHMNSTIDVMSDNPSAVSYLFRWAIRNFAKSFDSNEDYLNQRVSIFGCQQLSFRIGDFFKLENGDIVPKKNVSVLAWMIKEGKLKTDTEETILKDPFVFANGVASENGDLG